MAATNKNRKLEPEEITVALTELNSNAVNEVWKHFLYGYFISNMGRIWNECTKSFVNPYDKGKDDHHKVFDVYFEGKREEKLNVHRLVYLLFGEHSDILYKYDIVKDNSKYYIHHINMVPDENNIDNLYMILDTYHGTLHTEIRDGKIKLSDVDTKEKLDQWLMLHTDAIKWFTDEKNK